MAYEGRRGQEMSEELRVRRAGRRLWVAFAANIDRLRGWWAALPADDSNVAERPAFVEMALLFVSVDASVRSEAYSETCIADQAFSRWPTAIHALGGHGKVCHLCCGFGPSRGKASPAVTGGSRLASCLPRVSARMSRKPSETPVHL